MPKNSGTRKLKDQGDYKRTQMQKDLIIQKLKEQGLRITKQRLILLDIILEEDCSCCKEIYYKASQKDDKIGSATVYRMINTLEEIGAISRKNMYRVDCSRSGALPQICRPVWKPDRFPRQNCRKVDESRFCGSFFVLFRVRQIFSQKCESCLHERTLLTENLFGGYATPTKCEAFWRCA